MKKILLDANFLILPQAQKIDIFSEIARIFPEQHLLVTLSGIISELEDIRDRSRGRDSVAAAVGLKLAEHNNVQTINSTGNVDEAIVDYAITGDDVIVATNDKQIKKILRTKNISTLSPTRTGTLILL